MWFVQRVALFIVLLLTASYLGAQTLTGQQELLQQLRERDLREQQELEPDVRFLQAEIAEAPALLSDKKSPCFVSSELSLIGDTTSQFQFSLASVLEGDDPAICQSLGTQGINLVLKHVQNAIIERGYVITRVLIGPQDLTSGKLELTLFTSRINTIRFKDSSTLHGRAWNALPIKEGDLLYIRDIEQRLENFKRVLTADANIDIEPSYAEQAQPGENDMMLSVQKTIWPFDISYG
jgi:hemolysin activation/secretion protein